MLSQKNKEKLLLVAREAVEEYVKNGKYKSFFVDDKELMKKQGAFVTLRKDGELRGCIGYIFPDVLPLGEMIGDLAVKAATEDYRFSPVKEEELSLLKYEISILSVPVKINDWKSIKLGEHGVVVKKGMKSGVFLPQVAVETGWSLTRFLEELCEGKAGLLKEAYKNDQGVEILTFTAEIF